MYNASYDQTFGHPRALNLAMMAERQPTLEDVAREAGVSRFTVSAVLNGSRSNTRVSPATRARIEAAADALGYRPNAVARGLVRRRMQVLGVLFGPVHSETLVSNPYGSLVLQGVMNGCAAASCDVLLFTGLRREAAEVRSIADGRADGIVVVAPPLGTDLAETLAGLRVPIVTVSYPNTLPNVTNVDVDDVAGARMVARYLLSLGHRRIAHLTGNPDLASTAVRRRSFVEALQEAGVAMEERMVVACQYDGGGADAAMRALLTDAEPPTAVFAGNDAIAVVACSVARKLGVRVPQQLSVVGYDDVPAATMVRPQLTTVAQPLVRIGSEAASLLLRRLAGEPHLPGEVLVAPRLEIRGSTAPRP